MDELKSLFIVDESIQSEKIEGLVRKALSFCVVGRNGAVHLKDERLSARNKIKLTLAARALAAQMDEQIHAEVSNEELAVSTGLPPNQIRARLTEIQNENFADNAGRGAFKVRTHKIEGFLDELAKGRSA